MSAPGRTYRYVGPAGLQAAARPGAAGHRILSRADFDTWTSQRSAGELAEPFTFVVDTQGILRLAPRRSEHVACAGGEPVLSAGEIIFTRDGERWMVDAVSNQSTGYCPDITSWSAVAAALEQVGLDHPAGFTHPVLFRRCPHCRENNIVRDNDFVCVFCSTELPMTWNVDPGNRAEANGP